MKKSTVIIILVAVVLGMTFLSAGVYSLLNHLQDRKHQAQIDYLNELLSQKKEEKVVEEKIIEKEVIISGLTIQSGLRNIGELAGADYYFTHVSTIEESQKIKDFKIPFTTATVIFTYDGVIKAGVDFNAILVDKDDETQTITVTLPHSHILSSEIDYDSLSVYDEKTNIFTPITIEDYNDTLFSMVTEEEQKAIDKGVLVNADANIELMIRNFIAAGYDLGEYTIEIKYQ